MATQIGHNKNQNDMSNTDNNRGWVKLHRSILDWEWWDEPNTTRLFIYCILKANPADRQWHGQTIERGSFVTSLNTLAKDTGLTVQQTRTALNRLISTNNLTSKSTNKITKITVYNYERYQELQQTKQHTNQQALQQTNNKPITNEQQTDNNNEEYKNKRNNISLSPYNCAREIVKSENGEIEPEEGHNDPLQSQQTPTPLPPAPEAYHGSTYDTTENHYTRYRAELTAETMTSDAALRLAKARGKTLTREQLAVYLDRFQDTRRASGDTHTTHSDYRRHFTNWLCKVIDIETQQNTTKKHNYGTARQSERPPKIAEASEFIERL